MDNIIILEYMIRLDLFISDLCMQMLKCVNYVSFSEDEVAWAGTDFLALQMTIGPQSRSCLSSSLDYATTYALAFRQFESSMFAFREKCRSRHRRDSGKQEFH